MSHMVHESLSSLLRYVHAGQLHVLLSPDVDGDGADDDGAADDDADDADDDAAADDAADDDDTGGFPSSTATCLNSSSSSLMSPISMPPTSSLPFASPSCATTTTFP